VHSVITDKNFTTVGVHIISRSLAERTRGANVTVHSLLPGSTVTPGVQELVKKVFLDDEFAVGERRFMAENRPTAIIGRLIRPQEIADFAVFVCSGLAGPSTARPCAWIAASTVARCNGRDQLTASFSVLRAAALACADNRFSGPYPPYLYESSV
jgi:NAD(P)-dependent dehydrogenase (short-subunit alcohol dehydrogenase family)